jgi:ribokinase
VIVLGSLNVDLAVPVARLPQPGETVLGGALRQTPGGKGANQAVAAARLGARVAMAGRIGPDAHGALALEALQREGVSTELIEVDESAATGVARILVSDAGENMIAVTSGANANVNEQDVARTAARLEPGDLLVLQLEIPLPAVRAAAMAGSERGAIVVLNAAPAAELDSELLEIVDLLIMNEGEACAIFGSVEAAFAAACPVIVTLGAQGAIVADGSRRKQLMAPHVEPVDTTGAGDAFVGAIAAELSGGGGLVGAARLAAAAGAAATLSFGAQSALPRRDQLSSLTVENLVFG